ncbi:MAG: hypothetical protein DELT_02629 [Desulfovibrio sp.]
MRTATYSSLVLIASGFLFCLIILANGGAITCAGGGCSLYAGLEFLGLSFYAWGTMLFAMLLFAWGKSWFYRASLLALAADIPFLIWQGFMVPCTSCMTVSVLLTLNALMARAPARAFGPVRSGMARRLVIFAATALIVCGLINLCKETTAPWSINGRADSGRYLYFSPSCEPCRQHIADKIADGTIDRVALVPIALSRGDHPIIHAISRAYALDGLAGLQGLLPGKYAVGAETLGLIEQFSLTLKLHWNYAHLARSGGSGVPWYSGAPEKPVVATSRSHIQLFPSGVSACGAEHGQCATTNGGLAW